MKLSELKKAVYEHWELRCFANDAIVQPENFKPEIRQYGDLRRKSTWVKALCQFCALNHFECLLDAYELITVRFNFAPDDPRYPYRHQIFEAFLTIPGALDLLKTGLEQLFSSDCTTEEREAARGFFAMVEEQPPGRRVEWEPAQLVGRIAELAGATAG